MKDRVSKEEHLVHSSPVSSSVSDRPSLAEVKEKLQAIGRKRRRDGSFKNKTKSGKQSYVLVCGIKENRCGSWIQLRGKHSNYTCVKKTFNADADYVHIVQSLKEEFNLTCDLERLVLVGRKNTVIENTPCFSIKNYVLENRQYIGSTRIYLGVNSADIAADSKYELATEVQVKDGNIAGEVHCTGTKVPSAVTKVLSDFEFDTVVQHVVNEHAEQQTRAERKSPGGLENVDTQKFCPVYSKHPTLQLFLNKVNETFQTVQSDYGEFVCIPQSRMEELESFTKANSGSNLCLVDPPLQYFVSNIYKTDGELVTVEELSNNVWKIPTEVASSFEDWKQEIIDEYFINSTE